MNRTKKIRVVIVDDEKLARDRIRRLLEPLDEFEIISECANGSDAVKYLTNNDTDLLFLDIQMPEMDGFEVVSNLNSANLPVIIFVTAYDKYALKAFEIHAIDYLLKPFDDERFKSALFHSKGILKNKSVETFPEKIIELLKEKGKNTRRKYLERISVKSSGRIYFVNTRDIIRIKAAGKYLDIMDSGGAHTIRKTMTQMEKQLDPEIFIRVHRSVIVNIRHIKEMQHWYKNEYVLFLSNGEKYTSGSSYRKNLDRLLNSS
jgi:two-component system LytT family response regulator